MQEQRKRKPRIPLTPEELFYVIELKKLKQAQKIAAFKASKFYNVLNKIVRDNFRDQILTYVP